MEASATPDGKVKLVLPLSNLLLLQWALWTTITALDRDERWFSEVSGISLAQAMSLDDEMMAVRYTLEGSPRRISAVTGELVPPAEPRKTGTAWDHLPEIEAESLAGSQIAITLPRQKLVVLPGLLEASLVYVAPHRSESEESSFRMRFAASTDEAQALADELRRLSRRVRAHE